MRPRAEDEEADVHARDDEVMVEKKEEEEVEVDEGEEVYHESEGLDEEMTDEEDEEEEEEEEMTDEEEEEEEEEEDDDDDDDDDDDGDYEYAPAAEHDGDDTKQKHTPQDQKSRKRKRARVKKATRDGESVKEFRPQKRRPPAFNTGSGAPVNKRHRCEEVPRDKVTNEPILPIILTSTCRVLNLGTIVYDRPTYHNSNYIWPVGYVAEREYASFTQLNKKATYKSEILDNGENPLFKLTASDNPSQPILGVSTTAVWQEVVRRIADMKAEFGTDKRATELKELLKLSSSERKKQSGVGGNAKGYLFASISGPEYFCLSLPTVLKLVEEMPNADKCEFYNTKNFQINFDSSMMRKKEPKPSMRHTRPKSRVTRKPTFTQARAVGQTKNGDETARVPANKIHVSSGLNLMSEADTDGDTRGYHAGSCSDEDRSRLDMNEASIDEIESVHDDGDDEDQDASAPQSGRREAPAGGGGGGTQEHARGHKFGNFEGKSLLAVVRELGRAKNTTSRLNTGIVPRPLATQVRM